MQQDSVVITGRRRRQGSLPLDIEDAHVDPACLHVTPAQIPGRHHQRRLVAQNPAQVVQLAAQVGQRLGIRGLGPEQARDPLPGLRGPGMHDQEGDQDNSARRPGPDASGPVVGDCLLPQERHMQHVDLFSCSPLWAGWYGEVVQSAWRTCEGPARPLIQSEVCCLTEVVPLLAAEVQPRLRRRGTRAPGALLSRRHRRRRQPA